MKPSFWKTVWRSSRLRCPSCGTGHVAKNWRETHEECASCGFDFCVEGGFYLGAIYFNYGLSALLLVSVGIPLVWFGYLSAFAATITGGVVCLFLGVWFWRHARSLWLGFGYYIDHSVRAGEKETWSDAEVKAMQQTYMQPSEEPLDGICYFCHSRFQFARSRLSSWVACPFCQEKILLTRLPGSNHEDEPSEACEAIDSCTDAEVAHSHAIANVDRECLVSSH